MEKKQCMDVSSSIYALEEAVIKVANSLSDISSSLYMLEAHMRCIRTCDDLIGHLDTCEFIEAN